MWLNNLVVGIFLNKQIKIVIVRSSDNTYESTLIQISKAMFSTLHFNTPVSCCQYWIIITGWYFTLIQQQQQWRSMIPWNRVKEKAKSTYVQEFAEYFDQCLQQGLVLKPIILRQQPYTKWFLELRCFCIILRRSAFKAFIRLKKISIESATEIT